jgi:lactate dehydrogenase-like 2-hydroxyacid dehydrogenase
MPRPSVLLTRRLPEPVEARLAASYDLAVSPHDRPLTAGELAEAMAGYDSICPNPSERFDAAVFAAPELSVRIVANYGVGFEHIDLAAARRAGVVVTNTPQGVTEPTAELAILLMLMVTRRAGEGERELRAGRWTGLKPGYMLGRSLSGKLLGLVGFGRIAKATAARARAFGLRIAYFSRSRAAPEIEQAFGSVHYPSLDALVAEADILSLHCPGGAQTHHLIDGRRLALMKPGAVLINTARGSVVDEGALAMALASGRIGAGLDVYEREPAVTTALLDLDNVVLLPHQGSATLEARIQMGMEMVDNLDAFFAGGEPPNRVA